MSLQGMPDPEPVIGQIADPDSASSRAKRATKPRVVDAPASVGAGLTHSAGALRGGPDNSHAALTVLRRTQISVIGPTPPGTGETA
jgi:hypothetical protein